jgi:hypothetical protein
MQDGHVLAQVTSVQFSEIQWFSMNKLLNKTAQYILLIQYSINL